MDPRTESIKQEVEETLEDMAAKMEQIEERVVGTARETVEQVKEKLDVRHMVAQRPWTMLGVSVAAGFVVGSIRRSGARPEESEDWDGPGRALSRRRHAASRAFQYEHSEDPYQHLEDEDFEPEMLHGVSEGLRPGVSQEHGRRWGEERGEPMGYRGRGRHEEEEHVRPARQLVRRSISKVKQRAPGFLAALKEHFGDDLEALKRAAVVAAGSSLLGLMQKSLPHLAEEFDRARHDVGQHRSESGWQRGEQRQQPWGQGSEGRYEASEGRYGAEGRAGGQYQGQSRYNPETSQMGSSAEPEQNVGRNRGNESYGPEGGPGPSGRKSHN
jgi:hypothetical protein